MRPIQYLSLNGLAKARNNVGIQIPRFYHAFSNPQGLNGSRCAIGYVLSPGLARHDKAAEQNAGLCFS